MSKLCSNAANCGIKKIQNALPESLKTKVLQSINISTYVFVIKNKEQAKKLLKFLEEKGFSNISIDSKGTTITAQSSSGIINASNDTGCSIPIVGTRPLSGTIRCPDIPLSKCSKYFIKSEDGTCVQCILKLGCEASCPGSCPTAI